MTRLIKFGSGGYAVNAPASSLLATLNGQEAGNDTFAGGASVEASRILSMLAQESGADTFAASMSLEDTRTLSMAAQETGSDTFAATASVARTIDSLVVGTYSATPTPRHTVTVTSSDAQAGDTVYLVFQDDADTDPTDAQVAAGQAGAGGTLHHAYSYVWPGGSTVTVPAGIQAATAQAFAVIDNGALSNVEPSNVFELDSLNLTLSASTPADDATGVAVGADIIFDFDDDVDAAGTMTLKLVGGADVEVFDLSAGTGGNGGTVTLSANAKTTDRVTLNPGADMAASTDYAVRRAGVTDDRGNPIADVTDDTTHNFTTAVGGGGVTGLTSSIFLNNAGANYTFTNGPRPISDTASVLSVGNEVLIWVMMHSADAAITDANLHNHNLGAPLPTYETGGSTTASVFTWQETVTADMLDASAELTLTGTGGQFACGIIRIDGTLTTVTPVGNEWQMTGAVVDPLTVDVNTGAGWVVLFGVKDRIDLGSGAFTWTAGLSVAHAWTDNNFRHEIVTGTTTVQTPATYDATHGSVTLSDPGALLGVAFS